MSNNPEGKQRLLIVDDSKVIRVTARKILSNHFDTIEAIDGENAWEILTTQEPFALVVSDLTMPNLDGFGLLGRIRNSPLPHISDLPVIVITGANDSDSTMEKARQAGATDFIGKPFDSVLLLARTQSHANAHATTSTLMQEVTSLQDQATVDTLTELANEISFMERGYQQLSYAIRHNSSLAVHRIEIDDFGHLFQEYGEEFAESAIQATANVLGSVIRQEDTAARIGTARFALLSPGINSAGVRNLAERIRREIGARIFKHGNTVVRVTVSIGIASPDIQRNTRLDELISIADQRLARALNQGGNQVIQDGSGPTQTKAAGFGPVTEPVTDSVVTAVPVADAPAPVRRPVMPALDEIGDIEEIELFTPEFPQAGDPADSAPVPEARADSRPEPVPDTFAGPVPDHELTLSALEASVDTPATDSVDPAEIPTLSVAITPDSPSTAADDDWFGETPAERTGQAEGRADFSVPDPAPAEQPRAPEPAHVDIDRARWESPSETHAAPEPAPRHGLMARALASVGALFGRS